MNAISGEPKNLGELFSDATMLMRRFFRPIFFLALPFVAVELFARESASALLYSVRKQINVDAADVDALAPLFSSDALLCVALFFVSRLIIQGALATMTIQAESARRAAASSRGDEPLEPGAAFRAAVRFFPRLIVAELVFDFVLIFGALVPAGLIVFAGALTGSPILVGISIPIALVFSLGLGIAIYLRWIIYPQALVLEDLSVVEALRRSTRLMSPKGMTFFEGPKLRISILFLVYWALASSIQSMFLLPILFIGYTQGIPLEELPPPLTAIPLWSSIPLALLQVVANSVVIPIAAILPTLFYADLRVRTDDLEADAPR